MQGSKVEGWVYDVRTLLNTLNPALDNILALWDQFLIELYE